MKIMKFEITSYTHCQCLKHSIDKAGDINKLEYKTGT